MSESSPCPEPEVLAAFLDGRLSEQERRRVVAHLDACGDCYELFSEAVRFQAEEEPRGRLVGAERFGRPRWLWPAAAAAAVLVVLVAVPILRMEPGRAVVATLPGEDWQVRAAQLASALEVDANMVSQAVEEWPDPNAQPGFMGDGSGPEPTLQFGARLLDLHVASRGGDAAAVRTATTQLAAAMDRMEMDRMERTRALEDELDLVEQSAAEGRLEALRQAAAELDSAASKILDPLPLTLGRWAEAGRLAAAAGDVPYFESEPFRTPLKEIRKRLEAGALPEALAARLEEIDLLTRDGVQDPADLRRLQREFGYLILGS